MYALPAPGSAAESPVSHLPVTAPPTSPRPSTAQTAAAIVLTGFPALTGRSRVVVSTGVSAAYGWYAYGGGGAAPGRGVRSTAPTGLRLVAGGGGGGPGCPAGGAAGTGGTGLRRVVVSTGGSGRGAGGPVSGRRAGGPGSEGGPGGTDPEGGAAGTGALPGMRGGPAGRGGTGARRASVLIRPPWSTSPHRPRTAVRAGPPVDRVTVTLRGGRDPVGTGRGVRHDLHRTSPTQWYGRLASCGHDCPRR